jgi:quercetin dioxygenase-like cupin family protein
MTSLRPVRFFVFIIFSSCALLTTVLGQAQQTAFAVKPLLKSVLSGDNTKEVVVALVEFSPGGATGRHIHAGDEYVTVLQGTLEVRVDGKEPRRFNIGEAYHNPKGVIHEVVDVGNQPAKVAVTMVADTGQPMTTNVK